MKTGKLWCALALAALLAVMGCSSGSSNSSSEGGSTSGAGAVVTAFMQEGRFQVLDIENEKTYGPFTFEGSNFDFSIAGELPRPFVVEVTSATMCNGKKLQRKLSKVVKADDDISKIYITIFSTLEAEAYVQAAELGQEAGEVGEAAKMAAFNALGLDMEADVLDFDPRESPELEFAQQALISVMGLSDNEGLAPLDPADDPFSRMLGLTADQGANFDSGSFAAALEEKLGSGVSPASFVASQRGSILDDVAQTFANATSAGLTTITGEAAKGDASANATQKDLTQPGALVFVHPDRIGPCRVWDATMFGQGKCLWYIQLNAWNGNLIRGAKFTANGNGLKVAYTNRWDVQPAEGDWADGWTGSEAKVIEHQDKYLWIKVPEAGLPAGDYDVVLAAFDDPSVKRVVTVKVLGTDELTVKSVAAGSVYLCETEHDGTPSLDYIDGGFLAFQPEGEGAAVRTYIPKGAKVTIAFCADRDSRTYKPTISFKAEIANDAPDTPAKEFDLIVTPPEGVCFVQDGSPVPFQSYKIVYADEKWEIAESEDRLVIWNDPQSSYPLPKAKLLFQGTFAYKTDVELQAVEDIQFGRRAFKIRVEDPSLVENKVLASTTLPIWHLNKESMTWAASMEQAYRGQNGGENAGASFRGSDTDFLTAQLRGQTPPQGAPEGAFPESEIIEARPITWEEVTGIDESFCMEATFSAEKTGTFASLLPFTGENATKFRTTPPDSVSSEATEFPITFDQDSARGAYKVVKSTAPCDTDVLVPAARKDNDPLGLLGFTIVYPAADGPDTEPYVVKSPLDKAFTITRASD